MEPNKIKKVLIAIDYDKSAEIVAGAGYTLAKAMNAETILLHVIHERPTYYTESPSIYELHIGYIEDLKETTQNFLNEIKRHLGNESIRIVLEEGEIAQTILDTAKGINADIIVIGSHSRKWLENIILGNDAKSVLKKTTIPLFIVPIKAENK